MKTKEERNVFKEEAETLNKKLVELTDEELEQAAGGMPTVLRDERTYDLPSLETTAHDDHPLWIC